MQRGVAGSSAPGCVLGVTQAWGTGFQLFLLEARVWEMGVWAPHRVPSSGRAWSSLVRTRTTMLGARWAPGGQPNQTVPSLLRAVGGRFVSPQMHVRIPVPPGVGLEGGLWEVTRSWDGALVNGVSALIKGTPESSLGPSSP